MPEQNPDVDNMQFHGDIETKDGSAISPSLTNIGDTNTGIYFPDSDQVGVSTGGVHRATFKGTGLEVDGSITSRVASTNDSLTVSGRAGGSSSYTLTLSPNELTGNRTITFPDQSGVVVLAGSSGSGTAASISADNSTNTDYYPLLSNSTSGSLSSTYVSNTKLYFNPSTGQLNATNFNSLSDATLKTNIQTIDNALEKTKELRGVAFKWKDSGEDSLGFIAQEVEKVIPEAVHTSEKTNQKSVSYGMLIGLLVEAIKEQQSQLEGLKQKVEELNSK